MTTSNGKAPPIVVSNGAMHDIEVRPKSPFPIAVVQRKNNPHCPEGYIAFSDWSAVRRLADALRRAYDDEADRGTVDTGDDGPTGAPDWRDYVGVVRGPGYYRLTDGRVAVVTEFRPDYVRQFSIRDVHAWRGHVVDHDGSTAETNFTPDGRSFNDDPLGLLTIVGPVQGFDAKVC